MLKTTIYVQNHVQISFFNHVISDFFIPPKNSKITIYKMTLKTTSNIILRIIELEKAFSNTNFVKDTAIVE